MEDAVLIFDEAHNLASVLNDNTSFDISSTMVTTDFCSLDCSFVANFKRHERENKHHTACKVPRGM